MKKQITFLSIILILCCAISCRKNKLDPYNGGLGPEYYPLTIGSSWTYRVDSTHFNKKFGTKNDSFKYFIKNVIESEFIDNDGRTNQSFTRYFSEDGINWRVNGSFSTRSNIDNVVLNQNNKKEIILKYPIQEFDFWDGNSLNNKALQEFEYRTVHVRKEINGTEYDSTCTVLHQNVLNRVQTFFEENTYAKNIGLVHHIDKKVDEKDIDSEEPLTGFEVEYELIKFETQ